MTGSTFGKVFKVSTWGESHGEALGCILEGVPSKIKITEKFIQKFLERRKPGQSNYTTQRKEGDKVKILSGVFDGVTTGTPISLIIYNQDTKSKDYEDIKKNSDQVMLILLNSRNLELETTGEEAEHQQEKQQ